MRDLRIGIVGAGCMGNVRATSHRTVYGAFRPEPAVPVLARFADIDRHTTEGAARRAVTPLVGFTDIQNLGHRTGGAATVGSSWSAPSSDPSP
jgi:hypothetical protein